mmetsp:Transcript_30365/g.76372  ORF Transcript_30365/g.76372 Transcript_30365/m.76372 type:complete len:109 (+) Transcript_30365:2-328(+)
MYKRPAPGVPLSGGMSWWPPKDEIGNIFPTDIPVNVYHTGGPIVQDSGAYDELLGRLMDLFKGEMHRHQSAYDAKWNAERDLSKYLQGVCVVQRLKSKAQWMVQGMNG